ncbi:hypothetical protein Gorai_013636 [Gossypium raimondii]|uniref:Uncharacterized protein n=1 Tax=Gossypium raimondii TaxID=29730 RepID=A0A7J8Q5K1_GOSRA|nr:hypothetical protein [Gossypium raimondii]
MAGLRIREEEDEVLQVEGVLEDQKSMYDLCLVGHSDSFCLIKLRREVDESEGYLVMCVGEKSCPNGKYLVA